MNRVSGQALMRKLRRLSLSTQTLLMQLTIIGLVLLVVSGATFFFGVRQLRAEYGERSLTIAEAVAALPQVREAFDDPDPSRTIQPLAETIREAAGMTFVVVANEDGIRYSHPVPGRVGERVSTDPSEALSGKSGIYIEEGTLGLTVRGKAPVVDERGDVIGLASVGVLVDKVDAQLSRRVPTWLAYLGLALSLGGFGSWLVARRVRRQTLGLDPDEIATLYEHRMAMLLSIREGVIAVGCDGRIHLINAGAQRLLDLPEECQGRHIDDVLRHGRVHALISRGEPVEDMFALSGDRVLIVNLMPTKVRGERIGSVVTLRDRTELEHLLRELDSVRGVAQVMRAKAHEYSNQLHTIAGLIELGRHEDAVRTIIEASAVHQELIESLTERVGDPSVAALLLGKAAVAAEHGVQLRLSDNTLCTGPLEHSFEIVTILGNLIGNALDAVTGTEGPAQPWIEVCVRMDDDLTMIRVRDSGPGVRADLVKNIFREGFTTKDQDGHPGRGLGLALVAQITRRRGGQLRVDNEGGAVFTVTLPRRATPLLEKHP